MAEGWWMATQNMVPVTSSANPRLTENGQCVCSSCMCVALYTVFHKKMWHYICDHNSGKTCSILIFFTYLAWKSAIYLFIYFTCDVNVTSLSHSWHWWAATVSAACVARLRAVDDTVVQWPTRLRAWVRASDGHFEHTLWLSVCFLCTWWTLCFTPRLMQWVLF